MVDAAASRPVFAPTPSRRILAVAYEGMSGLDLFGLIEPFSKAAEILNNPGPPPYRIWSRDRPYPYAITLISPAGEPVATSWGGQVATEQVALEEFDEPPDTVLVPGGVGAVPWYSHLAVRRWLRRVCKPARRLCAVGGGVFALAASGLLEGRRVTTRFDVSGNLAEERPGIVVERDPTWVRDGDVWTGPGAAAVLDLGIAMVEADLGRAIARRVARQMIMLAQRPSAQPQVSAVLSAQLVEENAFDRLHDWIMMNLDADLRVEALADRAGMSLRNFTRRYAEVIGTPPAKAIELMRIEAARQAIEQGAESLERIAHRFGFHSEDAFRRSFARRMGMSPSVWRARSAKETVGVA